MIYADNEQILIEFKKLLLENKTSQKEVADRLNLSPQAFNKLLNKKNFAFSDMDKILKAIGYDLHLDFVPENEDK